MDFQIQPNTAAFFWVKFILEVHGIQPRLKLACYLVNNRLLVSIYFGFLDKYTLQCFSLRGGVGREQGDPKLFKKRINTLLLKTQILFQVVHFNK